jgi:hypothetical protein
MSSTDQTQDDQRTAGHHLFGRHRDDDDVLEGQLIEPDAESREDPAVAAADDPNAPVDDPIVMDAAPVDPDAPVDPEDDVDRDAPVDPEDDRVVLDSHDDDPQTVTPDPASPAAAGFEDRDGSYGSDGATTNSAIPMPGGPTADDATPVETTMDEGTPDGTAPVSDAALADATPAAAADPADGPAPSPVPTAETSGTTGEPVASNASATADRVASVEQWNEIKAMFVDDPRAATERAGSLVDSSVEALLASVKQQQQSMRSDWQGDGADTEKLRTALQNYRQFWARLEEFSRPA